MKFCEFGERTAPVILLLPGTCCHWKMNFVSKDSARADGKETYSLPLCNFVGHGDVKGYLLPEV